MCKIVVLIADQIQHMLHLRQSCHKMSFDLMEMKLVLLLNWSFFIKILYNLSCSI